jgi:hypothetical protein
MGRARGLDSMTAAMAAGELLLIQRYPFHLSAELSCAYGKAVLTARLAGRASLPSRYRPKRVRCSWSGQVRFMRGVVSGEIRTNKKPTTCTINGSNFRSADFCSRLLTRGTYANGHNR